MGGHAFKNTTNVNIHTLYDNWENITETLESLGCTDVTAIGSTFRKPVMGDIDVACKGNYTEILARAKDFFGNSNVKTFGTSTVSVSYPIKDLSRAQLDITVTNNLHFVVWSHAGTSQTKKTDYYSQFKGTVRQILITAIVKEKSERYHGHHNTDYTQVRYQYSIDHGLFLTYQIKISKTGKTLKNWKTVEKKLEIADPDIFVNWLFCAKDLHSRDFQTFESCFFKLKSLPLDVRNAALKFFLEDIEHINSTEPKKLTSATMSTEECVKTLKELAEKELTK